MHAIICPVCLGAKRLCLRQGWVFRKRWQDCQACEGIGECWAETGEEAETVLSVIEPLTPADMPRINLADVRMLTEWDFDNGHWPRVSLDQESAFDITLMSEGDEAETVISESFLVAA